MGIESTISCEFFAKTYTFPDDTSIKFLIWDTSGQEVFRTFTPQFCRAAYLALIFYDVGTTDDENKLVKTIKNWITFTPESLYYTHSTHQVHHTWFQSETEETERHNVCRHFA